MNLTRIALFALVAALPFGCQSANTPAPAPVVVSPTVGDPLVAFLRANPTRSAITLVRNDSTLVSLRGDQKMPLASTVKIIIALEFARQAASGKINPQELVPVRDLDLYYLPDTDGGAHPQWKADMAARNLPVNNRVPLLEVAKGMIRFSSNANTEYLLDRLGPDAVNASLTTLGLPRHDPVLPLVASLLLYSTADKTTTMQTLRAMSVAQYEQACQAAHGRLRADTTGALKRAFIFPDMDLQKLWSDRLTASTTNEYASVLRKISSRTYYPAAVQTLLDQIMEWPLVANPANKTVYQHLGSKGGSTAFVLTLTAYATTLDGNRTVVTFFFNNLTTDEFNTLRNNLNTFLANCLQTTTYRQVVNDLLR
jgi:D-alanyl-D-alanine carboxypeptidase